jgi:sugar phosphate permease
MVGMLTVSYLSDKTLKRKAFVWPFLLIGAIALYGSYLIGNSNFYFSFTLLVIAGSAMYAPYGPFFAIIPEVMPKNVAGVAMALINSMGALGSFVGAYLVGYLNGATGGFGTSYLFMASSLLLAAILTMIAIKSSNTTLKEKITAPVVDE